MTMNNQFSSLGLMANRLRFHGGNPQQDRMIKDKRRSLDHATKYSYQAAKIQHTESEDKEIAPAVIIPDKTKFNYDDKILSVGYEYGYQSGSVFDWLQTGTKWIIYKQQLDELAYFEGEIRRCNYTVSWEEGDKSYRQYIAVRGPVETRIEFLQKNGISLDKPNHSLVIYMTQTPEALRYFRRYAKFYLGQLDEDDLNRCWRVEATDSISTPGIFMINAVEYYANETEDVLDMNESFVGAAIAKPMDPNKEVEKGGNEIKGETFIKPKLEYTYFYRGSEKGQWSIITEQGMPVRLKTEGHKAIIMWDSGFSGQFTLKYGDTTKIIVAESLF